MLEIEVKCPVADLGQVEDRLKALGGSFEREVVQKDEYLSHPCREFAVTDEALRLRTETSGVVLHYKGPKLDSMTKTREELSMSVPDPGAIRMILSRLGFRPLARVEKVRRCYRLQGVEVCLDQVSGLGGFVELEVQDLPLEVGRGMIERSMELLGLETMERRSYLELLLEERS